MAEPRPAPGDRLRAGDPDPAAGRAPGPGGHTPPPPATDGSPPPEAGAVYAMDVEPTELHDVIGDAARTALGVRMFGTRAFFRLWVAQVISALGDWLGFLALIVIADRIGAESAIGFVVAARVAPGFFLAPVAGVVVDRFDRRRLMITCDLGRAAVLATVPFIDTVGGLVAASFLLEILTLLWGPAKEASVPNLVPVSHLTRANGLSLAAAYGTFPVASILFAIGAKVAEPLARVELLEPLRITQASVAIYVDVATFVGSALLISTLAIQQVRPDRAANGRRIDLAATWRDLREGWSFAFATPRIRAVMVALSTGLIGGGMLVPLGPVYAEEVLGGGASSFGLILTALGVGVGAGVIGVSSLQDRLPKPRVFAACVLTAGGALAAGASMSSVLPALAFVTLLGVCAGAVYVLGYTILHETVDDALRGRVFATLLTLVRFCVLVSFLLGPLLSGVLGSVSDSLVGGAVEVGGVRVGLPGVRLTLWFAALIIGVAGVLAVVALRAENGRTHPEERS